MGFWIKVNEFINYKSISRKELSFAIGVSSQTIDRAIERDSEPSLTIGLKVCKYLNVPVESFLSKEELELTPVGNETKIEPESNDEIQEQLCLYRKHHTLIANCEIIGDRGQEVVNNVAESLAEQKIKYETKKNI